MDRKPEEGPSDLKGVLALIEEVRGVEVREDSFRAFFENAGPDDRILGTAPPFAQKLFALCRAYQKKMGLMAIEAEHEDDPTRKRVLARRAEGFKDTAFLLSKMFWQEVGSSLPPEIRESVRGMSIKSGFVIVETGHPLDQLEELLRDLAKKSEKDKDSEVAGHA